MAGMLTLTSNVWIIHYDEILQTGAELKNSMQHSVVKFQSWAQFTNFKSKNWNEVGRDLREDCCE